ncbi:MAG: hypothetical protein L6405_02775 [Actinomycetia bacterium]|nr:hypothetical protein [Actinomycetes bacterium]
MITYRFAKFYPYYPSFNRFQMTATEPGYVTVRDVALAKGINFHTLPNSFALSGIYCSVLDFT